MCVCVGIQIHACHMYICVHVYIHIAGISLHGGGGNNIFNIHHICTFVYICSCIYLYVYTMCVCVRVCVRVYIHVAGISLHGGGGDDNPNVYDICTHMLYIHEHTRVHVYMNIWR